MPWLSVPEAAAVLEQGGLIAYPTEGVYGLGCDPLNPEAIARLLELKDRGASKGLILICGDIVQLEPYIDPAVPAAVWDRVLLTWPGPVTWIFPARSEVPLAVSGGRSSIAVRLAAHPPVVELTKAFGGAIISTSANRSGEPPARDPQTLLDWPGLAGVMVGDLGSLDRPTPIFDAMTGGLCRV